eukprot:2212072-Pyramimonas_sp.AAC.1
MKSNIAKARSVKAGSSPAPPVAESTATHDEYSTELRKRYIALDDSELRSLTGRKRAPKKLIDTLSQIVVPAGPNNIENQTLYMFADPERPRRIVDVVVRKGVN